MVLPLHTEEEPSLQNRFKFCTKPNRVSYSRREGSSSVSKGRIFLGEIEKNVFFCRVYDDRIDHELIHICLSFAMKNKIN